MDSSFWNLPTSAAFTGALLSHLESRRSSGRQSQLGDALLDVLDLDARIAMQGFADVFYQMLTATRCRAVHQTLHAMGLSSLAALFAEAFAIYSRGNLDISDAEFASLEPFALEGDAATRFDQIARLFVADDSEIYRMSEAAHAFALVRRPELE